MTYEDAQNEIVKKYKRTDWADLLLYEISSEGIEGMDVYKESAELYARSKWDQACEAQKKACEYRFKYQANQDICHKTKRPEFKP